MQNTKQKTKVKGAGFSGNPGPAVGSTWCASQRSISISSTTTPPGNARLNTETGLYGDKTINDLNTIGPLVAVNWWKYSLTIRYSSCDSDDDSSDSDEFRHRSPDVRLPEKQKAEIVAVDTTYYKFQAKKNYPDKQNTDQNSDPRSAELHLSSTKLKELMNSLESQSEPLRSLDLEQLALPSDSESNCSESDWSLRPAVSHLELNRSINDDDIQNAARWSSNSDLQCSKDDEEVWPAKVMQAWPFLLEQWSSPHSGVKRPTDDGQLLPSSDLNQKRMNQMWPSDSDLTISSHSSDLAWLTDKDKLYHSDLELPKCPSDLELIDSDMDDERFLPFNKKKNMVSFPKEEEITVVSIDMAECNDAIEATTRQPAPIRRSFLSALGRRVLSAARKLFCCGCCSGRKHRGKMEKNTKWKYYYPGESFPSKHLGDLQDTIIAARVTP